VTQRTRYTLALEIDRALGTAGTQFTCFTGTKVQILTPEEGAAVEAEEPKARVPEVVAIEVPEDARMCTLGVMLPGPLLGPKMQVC
jgi:hypothetical protein